MMGRCVGLLVALLVIPIEAARAADYKLESIEALSSNEVPALVRRALQPKGIRLLGGGEARFELWLRDSIPTQATSGFTLSDVLYGSLKKGTWMGILRIPHGGSDFRGQMINPGYYSLRYQHVLQDGNHMGVSMYRDFVLLIPAAVDKEIEKMLRFEEIVNLSRQSSGTNHPAVFSLAVPSKGTSPGKPSLVQDDMEHWVVETNSRAKPKGGGEPKEFPFAIVLVGQAEG